MKHRRVYFAHNGERSRQESAWSWTCSCGAQESASTKAEAEFEWRMHKARTRGAAMPDVLIRHGSVTEEQFVVRTTATGIAKIVHRAGCRYVDGAGSLFTPFIDPESVRNLKGWGVKMCGSCKPEEAA